MSDHQQKLADKVVLIAGGSGGIGQAVVENCAGNGAQVYLGFHRNETKAYKISEKYSGVTPLRLDVTDEGCMDKQLERIHSESGKLDGMVNCSGINEAGPLIAMDSFQIASQLSVNLAGSIMLTQKVLVDMVRMRSGSIVLLGSVSAHRMIRGHSVYSASMAGIEGFARALAAEVAKRGIRVNCVLPGPVKTPMLEKSMKETGDEPKNRVPMGRLIEAREVAHTISFLLSDESAAVTGTLVPVDGGYLLW